MGRIIKIIIDGHENKQCNGPCRRVLPLEDFDWRNKDKGWRQSECKNCKSAFHKIYYKQHKEVMNSQSTAYRLANPEVNRKGVRKYRSNNLEKVREANRRHMEMHCHELTPYFIKTQIARKIGLSAKDIPDFVVPLATDLLQAKRAKRANKKGSSVNGRN